MSLHDFDKQHDAFNRDIRRAQRFGLAWFGFCTVAGLGALVGFGFLIKYAIDKFSS